jgi:hypothetical protein
VGGVTSRRKVVEIDAAVDAESLKQQLAVKT